MVTTNQALEAMCFLTAVSILIAGSSPTNSMTVSVLSGMAAGALTLIGISLRNRE